MNLEFRVYHKQEERYGTRCDLDDHRIDYDFNCGMVNLEFAIKHPEWYIVEPWTGLIDKNGVKIFLGDIVNEYPKSNPECDWANKDKVVKYDQGSFNIGNPSKLWGAAMEYTVLGNENQNPDLLNDRK